MIMQMPPPSIIIFPKRSPKLQSLPNSLPRMITKRCPKNLMNRGFFSQVELFYVLTEEPQIYH